MLHIGCHLSISKGFLHMGQEAVSLGADTFQFFTRNPRGGTVRKLDIDDIYRQFYLSWHNVRWPHNPHSFPAFF